jgi:hypothetical protein
MIFSLLVEEKRTTVSDTENDPCHETTVYSRYNHSKSTKEKEETQDTIIEDQLKKRRRLNVIIAIKWVTRTRTIYIESIMFSMEISRINDM